MYHIFVDFATFCCQVNNLFKAEGGQARDSKGKYTPAADARREEAIEQFYYTLNEPFRRWLRALDADDDSETREERIQALRETAKDIALQIGHELVSQVSPAAYSKRPTKKKEDEMSKKKNRKEDESITITAPGAWISFKRRINKLLGAGKANQEQKETVTGGAEA